MSATNDITVYKGEAILQPFVHVTEGTTTPIDITGWTLVFTLKRRASDTVALLTVPAALTSPSSGAYTVSLTHAQTAALTAGIYTYDVQRTDAGSEAVVSIGKFTVTQEVLYP